MNLASRPNSNSIEENRLLVVAAFFDDEFSIDWILELTHIKASLVLKCFEDFCQSGILKKLEIDRYRFRNLAKKKNVQDTISPNDGVDLHRRIADLLWKERSDDPEILRLVMDQQFQFPNNLDECRRLKKIADIYQINGPSDRSLDCYKKVIHDLQSIGGAEADILFIRTVMGYSWDQSTANNPDEVISLLKEARERARILKKDFLEAGACFHLTAYEWLNGDFESAHENYNQGMRLAESTDNPEMETMKTSISIIHQFHSGRFKAVIKTFETAEPVFTKDNPQIKMPVATRFYLGLAYCYVGQVSQGRGMLEALRADSHKIGAFDNYAGASEALGASFMFLNDFDQAIIYLTRARSEMTKNSIRVQSVVQFNLAYCYFKRDRIEESKNSLEEALAICFQHNYNWVSSNEFLFELADAMDTGVYPRISGITLEKLTKLAKRSQSVFLQGIACRFTAVKLMRTAGDGNRIVRELQQSLAFLMESGQEMEIALSQLQLGQYYRQTGNQLEAKEQVTAAARILYPINTELVPVDLRNLVDFVVVKDDRMEEILSLGQQIMSGRNSLEVVQMIFSTTNRIVGAERAAIFLKKGDSNSSVVELWAAKNLTPEQVDLLEFSTSMAAVQESLRTGKVQSSTEGTGEFETEIGTHPIKSYICVPLVARGESIGSLYHDNRVVGSTFEKQDLKVITYFASFAAIALDNARAYEEIQQLNRRLTEEKQFYEIQHLKSLHFGDFIIASHEMKSVLSLVEKVAGTKSTVLITGETGVGKEIVARAIHRLSSRSDKPFINLNCGVLSETLVSSELFGHEKGAFTGATERHTGRFELADGGTLFLDEIGEISADLQVKLLRVLETRNFERVGGKKTLNSDFRLLVATNRDLETAVRDGRFRADLYYRLNVFPIPIPPLRERREDIMPLSGYFLKLYAQRMGKKFKGISEDKSRELLAYDWPGNVRELENVIERSVILDHGDVLTLQALNTPSTDQKKVEAPVTDSDEERQKILAALKRTNWKIYGSDGAARLLGISRSTFYSRMKKLGLKRNSRVIFGSIRSNAF
jgi:formate hydrogenlyase transcriptional activator